MLNLNDSDRPEPGLEAIGVCIPSSIFRRMLREMLAAIFPAWTIPELLCNPKAALSYVDAVRNRIGCRNVPEAVILRVLLDCTKE